MQRRAAWEGRGREGRGGGGGECKGLPSVQNSKNLRSACEPLALVGDVGGRSAAVRASAMPLRCASCVLRVDAVGVNFPSDDRLRDHETTSE